MKIIGRGSLVKNLWQQGYFILPGVLCKWENAGVIVSSRNNKNNYTVFTEQQVDRIKDVYVLRMLGIPLREINTTRTVPNERIKGALCVLAEFMQRNKHPKENVKQKEPDTIFGRKVR
jgi:DNA-binding transcriptional MerR regulator